MCSMFISMKLMTANEILRNKFKSHNVFSWWWNRLKTLSKWLHTNESWCIGVRSSRLWNVGGTMFCHKVGGFLITLFSRTHSRRYARCSANIKYRALRYWALHRIDSVSSRWRWIKLWTLCSRSHFCVPLGAGCSCWIIYFCLNGCVCA